MNISSLCSGKVQPLSYIKDSRKCLDVQGSTVCIKQITSEQDFETLLESQLPQEIIQLIEHEDEAFLIGAAGAFYSFDLDSAEYSELFNLKKAVKHCCLHEDQHDAGSNSFFVLFVNGQVARVDRTGAFLDENIFPDISTSQIALTENAFTAFCPASGLIHVYMIDKRHHFSTLTVPKSHLPVTCLAVSSNLVAYGTRSGFIGLLTIANARPDDVEDDFLYENDDDEDSQEGENETRQKGLTLHWHSNQVNALLFSSTGSYLLSGGMEGVLVKWDLTESLETYSASQKRFLARLGAPISVISATDRGRAYSLVLDNCSRLVYTVNFELVHWQLALERPRQPAPVCCQLDCDQKQKVLINGKYGRLQLLDVETGLRVLASVNVRRHLLINRQAGQKTIHLDVKAATSMAQWLVTYEELSSSEDSHDFDSQARLTWWLINSQDGVFYPIDCKQLAHLGSSARVLQFLNQQQLALVTEDLRVLCYNLSQSALETVHHRKRYKRVEYSIWTERFCVDLTASYPNELASIRMFGLDAGRSFLLQVGNTCKTWSLVNLQSQLSPVCSQQVQLDQFFQPGFQAKQPSFISELMMGNFLAAYVTKNGQTCLIYFTLEAKLLWRLNLKYVLVGIATLPGHNQVCFVENADHERLLLHYVELGDKREQAMRELELVPIELRESGEKLQNVLILGPDRVLAQTDRAVYLGHPQLAEPASAQASQRVPPMVVKEGKCNGLLDLVKPTGMSVEDTLFESKKRKRLGALPSLLGMEDDDESGIRTSVTELFNQVSKYPVHMQPTPEMLLKQLLGKS